METRKTNKVDLPPSSSALSSRRGGKGTGTRKERKRLTVENIEAIGRQMFGTESKKSATGYIEHGAKAWMKPFCDALGIGSSAIRNARARGEVSAQLSMHVSHLYQLWLAEHRLEPPRWRTIPPSKEGKPN
jgi:hypothetical protein